MIATFRCSQTRAVFERSLAKRFSMDLQKAAYRKLMMIHTVGQLGDLRSPPGNRLEALHGDREGQWSVRISGQWRICFRWVAGNAYDVEIVDYH